MWWGGSGRTAVTERLPGLKRDWKLDCVIVNGENAAGGFGITEPIYTEMIDAGADAITGGNHSWDQREALVFIERAPRLIRPLNYPPGTPGRGMVLFEAANGARVLVINLMGRVFMDPLDDPFAVAERELSACPLKAAADAIVVDMHCEATSEKQAMGHFCDGRASLVVGTHTHVPTVGSPRAVRRHRVHHRCRHDRRLRFRHRHEQGRAAASLHAHASRRASSSPRSGRRRLCASRSRPTTRRGSRPASRRCGSAGSSHEARPAFWE